MNFLKRIFAKTEKEKPVEIPLPSNDLSPQQFHSLLQTKKIVKLIDVRTKEEFDEGHILHAVLLPIQELTADKIQTIAAKDDEILLYCRSGGRSGRAMEIFHALGYTNTKHLDGGILAWNEERYPLVG